MLEKLRRYGLSGLLSYGLLNTSYYISTFLLVWFYVVPGPGKLVYLPAVKRKSSNQTYLGSRGFSTCTICREGIVKFQVSSFKFQSEGKINLMRLDGSSFRFVLGQPYVSMRIPDVCFDRHGHAILSQMTVSLPNGQIFMETYKLEGKEISGQNFFQDIGAEFNSVMSKWSHGDVLTISHKDFTTTWNM